MDRNKFLLILIPGLLAAGGVTAAYLDDHPSTAVAGVSTAMMTTADIQDKATAAMNVAADAAHVSTTGADNFRLLDGRVDAHLRNTHLAVAAARIATGAGIELVGGEALDDVPVQVDLNGVPAAEALLRLTAGYGSSFEYRGSRVVRMTIAAASHARDNESAMSATDWAASFDRMEPEQRGDAIETVASHGDDRAREAVAHALTDEDEAVRLRALEQTQVISGLALPVEALQRLLTQDASENVRLKALDVLATDPAVDANTLATIAGSVSADPSEQVRSQAQELRRRLDQVRTATVQ